MSEEQEQRCLRIRANLNHYGLIMEMQPWNKGAEEAYNRALEAYEAILGEVEVLHGEAVQAQEQ